MPEHEEHCLHSLKRYGVRGDDIHSWMDEPSSIAGGSHRDFRHELSSLPAAIQIFGSKYGADMVENIFLDHLKADSEENRRKEVERSHIEEKPMIWTFPVPSLDSTVDGLGRYLESTVISAPKSAKELVSDVKRIITYQSYYEVNYSVNQIFRTSVGQVHQESADHERILLNFPRRDITDFLGLRNEIQFSKTVENSGLHAMSYEAKNASEEALKKRIKGFVKTVEGSDIPVISHEVENPREEALKRIKELHSKSISYRARTSNRRYTKQCGISDRNIRINAVHLLYLPVIKLNFKLVRTPYSMITVQKSNGKILNLGYQDDWRRCVCNTCGVLLREGGSLEEMEGFRCSKCGQITCRKDGHWRKKHIFSKELVCPSCYEKGKSSGISYSDFG